MKAVRRLGVKMSAEKMNTSHPRGENGVRERGRVRGLNGGAVHTRSF